MNIFDNRYLFNIFLSADDILVVSRDVKELLSLFGDRDLLPVSAMEQDLSVSRIGFRSSNGEWEVLLFRNNFFVRQNSVIPFGKNLQDFKHFCDEASEILSMILTYFNRKVYRLAAVRREIIYELSPQQLHEIRESLLIIPDTRSEEEPYEWDWRIGHRSRRTIASRKEPTNEIALVQRRNITIHSKQAGQPQSTSFEGLLMQTDINTIPDNVRARFGVADLQAFSVDVPLWLGELRESVLLQIRGNINA